jgi:hypothetical protein
MYHSLQRIFLSGHYGFWLEVGGVVACGVSPLGFTSKWLSVGFAGF